MRGCSPPGASVPRPAAGDAPHSPPVRIRWPEQRVSPEEEEEEEGEDGRAWQVTSDHPLDRIREGASGFECGGAGRAHRRTSSLVAAARAGAMKGCASNSAVLARASGSLVSARPSHACSAAGQRSGAAWRFEEGASSALERPEAGCGGRAERPNC